MVRSAFAEPGAGLWLVDRGHWGAGPSPIPDDPPRVPRDYAHSVHVLARIQERSGVEFVMPEELSDEDAESIGVTDALLMGRTLAGRWTEVSIPEDPQLLGILAHSEHEVMFQFRTTHALSLGHEEIVIGKAEYRLLEIRLAEHDQQQKVIRLRPGQNDRFEVRLVAVEEKRQPNGSTAWVPAPMLEPYAGRWIAQSGTQVLLSADSFLAAADKVRASGQLATIWRVPGSTQEAEALPAVGL